MGQYRPYIGTDQIFFHELPEEVQNEVADKIMAAEECRCGPDDLSRGDLLYIDMEAIH